MRKTVLEIYALAVCFVAVVCFVVASGLASYALIGIANPEFTVTSWVYTQHQTNDSYWTQNGGQRFRPPIDVNAKERPPESELTKQREASYASALSNERRDSGQALVKAAIVMGFVAIVFLLHWLIARRERRNAV